MQRITHEGVEAPALEAPGKPADALEAKGGVRSPLETRSVPDGNDASRRPSGSVRPCRPEAFESPAASRQAAPLWRWSASLLAVLEALVPWIIGAGAAAAAAELARGKRRRAACWTAGTGALLGSRRLSLSRLGQFAAQEGGGEGGDARADHQRVRLATANVRATSARAGALADELARMQADIVVLQEVTPRHLDQLRSLGTLAGYPYNAVMPDRGAAGLGVWSRFELSGVEWLDAVGELQLRAWVDLPRGEQLRLYAIHAPAPVPEKIERWHQWFRAMAIESAREIGTHRHPLVLVGDFNATVDHRRFRRLLRTGLRDSALATGMGWRMTWTVHWRRLPALFRIDHVLVSAGTRVERYEVGRPTRSDHRPVFVELTV